MMFAKLALDLSEACLAEDKDKALQVLGMLYLNESCALEDLSEYKACFAFTEMITGDFIESLHLKSEPDTIFAIANYQKLGIDL